MNLAAVAQILAGFVLFFSLAQGVPLGYALLADRDHLDGDAAVPAFVTGIAVGVAVAFVLWLIGRRARGELFRREALAVVGLAWVLASTLGAVPFVAAGALPNGIDAVFETVSGLTTTGASVLGSAVTPAIESLPDSVLLWRAMLQWLGGMGIILVFVVLLPAIGVTGKSLLSSEQVGVADHSTLPRMQEQARGLFAVYLALTVADAVLLRLAGMPSWFEAVTHAFTTMATGGFSVRNQSIGAYHNVAIEVVTILFMVLAGTSFVLLLSIARNGVRKGRSVLNPETKLYLGTLTALVVCGTAVLWGWGGSVRDALGGEVRDYSRLGVCLRDAAFNLVSNQTCTGYATVDYQTWPLPVLLMFLFAMFVGGCTGSTAGGIKVLRLLVSAKLMAYTARHFLRPKSVEKIKVGGEVVPNSVISGIVAIVLMWLTCITIGTLTLALDPRVDLLSAVSTPISMLACCGPGISTVQGIGDGVFAIALPGGVNVGPAGSFGELTTSSKSVLCCLMIFGRLEILAPLMLFLPGFWRG